MGPWHLPEEIVSVSGINADWQRISAWYTQWIAGTLARITVFTPPQTGRAIRGIDFRAIPNPSKVTCF